MSDNGTRRMLKRYDLMAPATMFLASHFVSNPEDLHSQQRVEIDVVRHGKRVALVLSEISANGELISSGSYTNKDFEPPVIKQKIVVDAFDKMLRQPGSTAYEDVDQASVLQMVMRKVALVDDSIGRHIELQASSILQTGVLTLPRKGGGNFTLSFSPKSTHFPAVGTDWGDGGEDKIQDLLNLHSVIKTDGKINTTKAIFGEDAWLKWQEDSDVRAILDNRRIEGNEIAPRRDSEDATYQGRFAISGMQLEMWTYDGSYENTSGTDTPYVDPDNVIMMADNQVRAPLKKTMGSIPKFSKADNERALSYVPRTVGAGAGKNISVGAWFDAPGEALTVQAGTRPLLIPVAIDSFGCLTTLAP